MRTLKLNEMTDSELLFVIKEVPGWRGYAVHPRSLTITGDWIATDETVLQYLERMRPEFLERYKVFL